MNSMTFLKIVKVSVCGSMLLLSSCCHLGEKPVWPQGFPNRAEVIRYERDPVQSYNKTNKTYNVTSEFMENSLNNKIFIEEILIWKGENGIR